MTRFGLAKMKESVLMLASVSRKSSLIINMYMYPLVNRKRKLLGLVPS